MTEHLERQTTRPHGWPPRSADAESSSHCGDQPDTALLLAMADFQCWFCGKGIARTMPPVDPAITQKVEPVIVRGLH
jgi:hypothetical protein